MMESRISFVNFNGSLKIPRFLTKEEETSKIHSKFLLESKKITQSDCKYRKKRNRMIH